MTLKSNPVRYSLTDLGLSPIHQPLTILGLTLIRQPLMTLGITPIRQPPMTLALTPIRLPHTKATKPTQGTNDTYEPYVSLSGLLIVT